MSTPQLLTLGMVEARNVERATGLQISVEPRRRSRLHLRLAATWGPGQRPAWQPGQGLCKVCGKGFCEPGEDSVHVTLFGEPMTFQTSVCGDAQEDANSCAALAAEHYGTGAAPEDQDVSLTPKWDELCPPRFKSAIALEPLAPTVDAAQFARVRAWRPSEGGKGLYILGDSGSGKTTAFWALAADLERTRTTPVVLTSLELSRVLQEAARDIRDVAWLTRCRVLMVDDLGKERATPAASALFWEVLDRRYGLGLPCIFTSRFGSRELAERFGEASIGQDIIRRLFDVCDGIRFAIPRATEPAAA